MVLKVGETRSGGGEGGSADLLSKGVLRFIFRAEAYHIVIMGYFIVHLRGLQNRNWPKLLFESRFLILYQVEFDINV